MNTSRGRSVLGAVIVIGALCGAASPARAQNFTAFFTATLTSDTVIPPVVVPPGTKHPQGLAVIKVIRNSSSSAHFDFEAAVTGLSTTDIVIDVLLNQGGPGTTGPPVGFSDLLPVDLSGGDTLFGKTGGSVVPASIANQILNNPSGFYINVKTLSNPGGALRGQLERNTSLEGLGLKVFTNAGTYAPGDPFEVDVFLANAALPFMLDLFTGLVLSPALSALICAGGNPALVFIGPNVTVDLQCLNTLNNPVKFDTITVPAGLPMQKRLIWNVNQFPGVPDGPHQVFVCYQNPAAQPVQPVCDTTAFATSP